MPDNRGGDQVWLSVIGLGEDGPDGLTGAARAALAAAEIVAGGARHLDLVRDLLAGRETFPWETPFSASIERLLGLRGRRVAVLASGDPFWHGAGAVLADHVPPQEMHVFPAPSTFSLTASRLRWRIEETTMLGLHARPLALVRPHLRPGARLIVLVRDAPAVAELASLVAAAGFADTRLTILEALGGPRERVRSLRAGDDAPSDIAAPVAVALAVEPSADARIIPFAPGLPDEWFENDGQLTKREIRALTLSSLAPVGGELLWDIGLGAGSVAIEWLLAHPRNRAVGVETRPDRLARAGRNALALGVPHLDLREGRAPDILGDLPDPDAIFIGGGASVPGMLDAALSRLRPGGRLVVNAVTLETEALLIAAQARHGGTLVRIGIDRASTVGERRGWRPAMPVTHWSLRL